MVKERKKEVNNDSVMDGSKLEHSHCGSGFWRIVVA